MGPFRDLQDSSREWDGGDAPQGGSRDDVIERPHGTGSCRELARLCATRLHVQPFVVFFFNISSFFTLLYFFVVLSSIFFGVG